MHSAAKAPLLYRVTLAKPQHHAAVFRLLPGMLAKERMSEKFFIAHIEGSPAKIIGAAAVETSFVGNEQKGFIAHFNVLPDYRRNGVGKELLTQLERVTRDWGVHHLYIEGSHTSDSDVSAFAEKSGFQVASSLHTFYGEFESSMNYLRPLVDRLHASNKVNATTRLINLEDADKGQVIELLQAEYRLAHKKAQRIVDDVYANPLTSKLSCVLANDSDLIAFILAKVRNGESEVMHWVSNPKYRMGWPAAFLLYHFGFRNKAAGFGGAKYSCNDKTRATLNIAKRTGAKQLSLTHSYVKELP